MTTRDRSASRITVVLALTMNALIAVAKLVAGAVSGSSSMLAEGAHSVADTVNELFLLTSLRRSARPPDSSHPFGYSSAGRPRPPIATSSTICAGPATPRSRPYSPRTPPP